MKPKAIKAKSLTIVHLYPEEMNIYGDFGNILALVKRLEWRGFEVNLVKVGIGQSFDFTTADIVFGGGGQDSSQLLVGNDLLKREQNINQAVERGVVMLMVCGMYQLFGRFFEPVTGDRISGVNIFGAETFGSNERMIGNIIVESEWGRIVGFENHSGKTYVEEFLPTLGKVIKGFGNDGTSGHEGAIVMNAYGTYLHGPILPKNPRFCDHLLKTALIRKYTDSVLDTLNDDLENTTQEIAANRPQ